MTKAQKLNNLYKRYHQEFQGKEIVLGDGSIDCKILLVGEAPGRDEVRMGKPFAGAAGKNLNEFLDILEIDRQSVYITNAIKYRLSKTNEKTGRVVNRPASREEIILNRQYLLEEICIIDPMYIVTLGNVPLKAITGEYNMSIGVVHGKSSEVTIQGQQFRLYPLYHPASIIYNRSLKDIYINDIKILQKKLK